MKAPLLASLVLTVALNIAALAQDARYNDLADQPFINGYLSKEATAALQDEKTFERAVQAYTWMLPALNMYSMKEGSERVFGKRYNVLPIWKDRLSAKTLVTTLNSDVIYAMGYVDLHDDGPLVIEAPPDLQGILDDFFQRPICSTGQIDERVWCGDVGLPGPDKGRGANTFFCHPITRERLLTDTSPTDPAPTACSCSGVASSRTPPVRVMEQTRIYPLGKEVEAKPMQFPNGSARPANMLFPGDGTAFDIVNRYIQHEYVDPADFELRGMLAEFLDGANRYKLNLPKDIPAHLFWSVTVYDAITGSGLDNGQPFPSLNQMDKPAANADGSTDIFFGPSSPGDGKNWLRTVPGQSFFVILRIYGPTQAFFDKTWVPGDLEKVN